MLAHAKLAQKFGFCKDRISNIRLTTEYNYSSRILETLIPLPKINDSRGPTSQLCQVTIHRELIQIT